MGRGACSLQSPTTLMVALVRTVSQHVFVGARAALLQEKWWRVSELLSKL